MIPSFRDAAAAAFGERWASAPSGWYDPGGDRPSFVSADLDDESDSDQNDNGERGRNRSGNQGGTRRHHRSRSRGTTPTTFEGRVDGHDRRGGGPRGNNTERKSLVLTTPPRTVSTTTVAADAAGGGCGDGGRLRNVGMAPSSEPSRFDADPGSSNTGRDRKNGDRGSTGGGADGSTTRRLHTTERNNAKDLAQYLGGREEDSDKEIGSETGEEKPRGRRGRGKGGEDGRELPQLDEVLHEERGGDESVQVRRGRRYPRTPIAVGVPDTWLQCSSREH